MPTRKQSLSVVVPIWNEAESIHRLFEDCKMMCDEQFAEYEIIIVNDGSTDDTRRVCQALHPVKYVEFENHYG